MQHAFVGRRSIFAFVIWCSVSGSQAWAQSGAPFHFERVATLGVSGVAEIVDATADGDTLVYTNADNATVGVVDITNPENPIEVAILSMPGQPTSVSIVGTLAVVNVWIDQPANGAPPPAFGPGALVVIDVSTPATPVVVGSVPIGFHPDSVKLTMVGGQLVAIIAIENEPVVVVNGVVTSEDRPGSPNDVSPAGLIQVVILDPVTPANSLVTDVALPAADLAAAGLLYPSDPQPEFVSVHGTIAAVTLQENNGVAIVDFSVPTAPALVRVFSVGSASNRPADLVEDDAISFANTYPAEVGVTLPNPVDAGGNQVTAGARFPDAIAFTPDGTRLITADEGEMDYTGGRGISAHTLVGALAFEITDLEDRAVRRGHYPEGRSANKGIEMEGVATAVFGSDPLAFALSERGSFLAIYRLNSLGATLVQIISTGVSPEGVVAIPSRNLVVTSEEVSGTLTIFERRPGVWSPPSDSPILFGSAAEPFAAISGLCPAPGGAIFGVPDNALPTNIYRIDVGGGFASVDQFRSVTINGVQAQYDGEGICVDRSIAAPPGPPGWWIASEGNATTIPNLLVQVGPTGDVLREIQLPNSIDAGADPAILGVAQGPLNGSRIRSNGFEGVTLSEDGRYLLVSVQREFAGEPRNTRIARYDLAQLTNPSITSGLRTGGDWDFFYYPLEAAAPGRTVGLSEITTIGPNQYIVIERDNGLGLGSALKRIYAFSLNPVTPDADGVAGADDTITKILVDDVLEEFFPFEKIEGLALLGNGHLWIGLDNDGGEVESRLLDLGAFQSPITTAYPGTADGSTLEVTVDGASSVDGIIAVSGGESMGLRLLPNAAVVGGAPIVALQVFTTHMAPSTASVPNLYLDLSSPALVALIDGTTFALGIAPNGLAFGPLILPPFTVGTSVMLQGGILSSGSINAGFALTNGVELRGN